MFMKTSSIGEQVAPGVCIFTRALLRIGVTHQEDEALADPNQWGLDRGPYRSLSGIRDLSGVQAFA